VNALRRPRLAATLALAGSLALLWIEGFARHTDDGCPVEVHCLACRTAVVRSSSPLAAVDPTPELAALHPVNVPAAHRSPQRSRIVQTSRGPPLSA
jgi:hypothetical protein